MFSTAKKILCFIAVLMALSASAQPKVDTTAGLTSLYTQRYPKKVLGKMHQYEKRLTGKTEKTLTRLSKWENKIRAILKKADPQAEARLFSNEQMTFSSLLAQLKSGEAALSGYRSQYNACLDTLTTSLQYLKETTQDGIANTAIEKAS